MQNPSNTLVSSLDVKPVPSVRQNGLPDILPGLIRRTGGGAHALSRRAFLRSLPAAGAMLALPFPDFGAAGFPTCEDDNGEPPHPILSLPFVRQSTDAERSAGALPRCFWSVSPCGVHGTDCGTGTRYAEAALNYMEREQSTNVFQWAVLDMIRQGCPHSGIEIGFLSVFGRLASEAWEARMTIKAGDLA